MQRRPREHSARRPGRRRPLRALLALFAVLALVPAAAGAEAAAAGEVRSERVLPAGLTPAQRASVLLEPECADSEHGQVDRLYLHGYWRFRPVFNLLRREGGRIVASRPGMAVPPASDAGLEQGWFQPAFDCSQWDEMPVPWVWNIPVGETFAPIAFAGLGYYRTGFTVPADRAGRRAVLHCDAICSQATIWINGRKVGEHANAIYTSASPWLLTRKVWMDQFELDVTDAIRCGVENTIAIRVFDSGQPITFNQPADGGIVGPIHLEFREQVHFDQLRVAASPDDGQVVVEARAQNHGAEVEVALEAEVDPFRSRSYQPPAGARSARIALGALRIPAGASSHRFAFAVPGAIPWDVDRPALYRLRLVDGARVLGQVRIGFRSMAVEGRRFLLNGRPLMLRGLQSEPWGAYQKILVHNKADLIRQGLVLLKEAGYNAWRDNGGFQPQNLTRAVLDLCDELGLVVQTDFSPDLSVLDAKDWKPEAMTAVRLGALLDAGGGFNAFGREALERWLAFTHNHPAVCLFTGGNEIGFAKGETEQAMAGYLAAFYRWITERDLQRRPVTSSAGLVIYGGWKTPVPADYYDYHCYAEEVMGYLDASAVNRDAVFRQDRLAGIYGAIERPVVLGECLGFSSRGNALRPDIQRLFRAGALDRAAYVAWANANNAQPARAYWDVIARQAYAAYAGIRSVADRASLVESTARLSGGFLERLRRDTDFHAGVMTTRVDFTDWGLAPDSAFLERERVTGELAARARASREFQAIRRGLAPLAVFSDLIDRHHRPGGRVTARLAALNEQYGRDEAGLALGLALVDQAGGIRTVSPRTELPLLPSCSRVCRELVLDLPADLAPGRYTVQARLMRADGTVAHDSATPVVVIGEEPAAAFGGTPVALYEGAAPGPLRTILAGLGIPCTPIDRFDGLQGIQALIIAPDALDGRVAQGAGPLRAWLEAGGRLLCLEQSAPGEIPFLPGTRIVPAGPMLFADLIDPGHAALGGLGPDCWELWNGRTVERPGCADAAAKAVYRALVVPMPPGTIVSGANRTWRDPDPLLFGLVVGEIPVGRGMVMLSQALAVARHGQDPVATRYLRAQLARLVEAGGR